MQNSIKKTRPAIKATATMLPMTIPAIAPPDSPLLVVVLVVAAAAADDDAALVSEVCDVLGVAREMVLVIVGSTTPTHLDSACEL
jgi:hypothetical protein